MNRHSLWGRPARAVKGRPAADHCRGFRRWGNLAASMPDAPAGFIGLGSNLGERERALEGARRQLAEHGFRLRAESSLYDTEPVGGPPQGWFLNQVVGGE